MLKINPPQSRATAPAADDTIAALLDLLDRAETWTREHLARSRAEATRLQATLSGLAAGLTQRETMLLQRETALSERDRQLDRLHAELTSLQETLALRDAEIRRLEASMSWRITRPLRVMRWYIGR